MPRTRLGSIHSKTPEPNTPIPSIPEEEKKPKLAKIPGMPFQVDLDTGLIYLDKGVLSMLK